MCGCAFVWGVWVCVGLCMGVRLGVHVGGCLTSCLFLRAGVRLCVGVSEYLGATRPHTHTNPSQTSHQHPHTHTHNHGPMDTHPHTNRHQRAPWTPRSPNYRDVMLQAHTRASLTRLPWSNQGLWWPTRSARRSIGALANTYEPAVWWG